MLGFSAVLAACDNSIQKKKKKKKKTAEYSDVDYSFISYSVSIQPTILHLLSILTSEVLVQAPVQNTSVNPHRTDSTDPTRRRGSGNAENISATITPLIRSAISDAPRPGFGRTLINVFARCRTHLHRYSRTNIVL